MMKPQVIREVVLPFVGVVIVERLDGWMDVEAPGVEGHEYGDFDHSLLWTLEAVGLDGE